MDHLELADDYFEALLPEMEPGDENIIIDNHSNPPLPFAHVEANRNLGFSRACNIGLRRAKAEAVLFLNNDIALGRRGWLEPIREALAPGELVGRVRFDPHAHVDGTPMPYIDGWCLAGMKEDLRRLGGFNTKLEEPAYYSDNILCLDARAAGMTLRDVRVDLRHKESTTSEPLRNPLVREVTLANRELYLSRARAVLATA